MNKISKFLFEESIKNHPKVSELIMNARDKFNVSENEIIVELSSLLEDKLVISKHLRLYKK